MNWGRFSNWGGGRSTWGGNNACQSKSYHDGGVRDGGLDNWYGDKLSNHFGGRGGRKHWQHEEDDKGSGTGGSGTGGSGKGGSGTGGSGKDGSGKDGCNAKGDGGGQGRWGHKNWWQHRDQDDDKHGSGTDGSGSCGKGTGGTGGTGKEDGTGKDDGAGDEKPSITFDIGGDGAPSVTVEVVQNTGGQLFIKLEPTSYDGDVADIDGLFFNMSDDADVPGLNFFPDENTLPVTGHAAQANAVNTLDDGATVPENFDGMVQFGQSADSTEGDVSSANFTLWSDDGLTLDDIDLSSMSLVISNSDGSQQVISGGYDPATAASDSDSYANGGVSDTGLDAWYSANMADPGAQQRGEDDTPGADDIMALMNQPVDDLAPPSGQEDEDSELEHYI
jgi:hypothetical protein